MTMHKLSLAWIRGTGKAAECCLELSFFLSWLNFPDGGSNIAILRVGIVEVVAGDHLAIAALHGN